MTVIRTVLGDVDSADFGVCFAHEHLIIDGGIAKIINPEISLQSVAEAVAEVSFCTAAGVRAMVDAMPADAGRNVVKLADISRRSGMHIVAATGLHHERYYGERHWGSFLEPAQLAELFIADVLEGIDAHDLNGPVVLRTEHRAGVIKVAGSANGLSDRDARVFEGAAIAVRQTGVPLMTHCEGGTGGTEQLATLSALGVPPDRVILSHTDKVADLGYHRELLGAGVWVVYDQGIRSPAETARIVLSMVKAGFAGRLLLGTDGARRSLWQVLGGRPGLAALRTGLGEQLASELGPELMHQIWIDNPAVAFGMKA